NQNLDQEQKEKIRIDLAAAQVQTQQTLKEIEEAKARSMSLQQDRMQAINQQGQERVNMLMQERNTLQSIIQQERSRIQGMREQLGLQTPLQRQQQLETSRKTATGEALSRRELEMVRGNSMFSGSLAKIGANNAGPEFDEIVRNLGLDRRQQEAEAAQLKL